MSGSYILVIQLQEESELKIGALGSKVFKKGYYLYVGSAMGKRGSTSLINRVKRHISSPCEKSKHWHIDYLLENEYANIIRILLIPSINKIECIISSEIKKRSDGLIENFGSSDCTCRSHLYYFSNYYDIPFKL